MDLLKKLFRVIVTIASIRVIGIVLFHSVNQKMVATVLIAVRTDHAAKVPSDGDVYVTVAIQEMEKIAQS